MNPTCCHACGQPLPVEPRRDPPLAPLEHPDVVTIHDLPAGAQAEVEVITSYPDGRGAHVRRLKLAAPCNSRLMRDSGETAKTDSTGEAGESGGAVRQSPPTPSNPSSKDHNNV